MSGNNQLSSTEPGEIPARAQATVANQERFDPREGAGKLIDAEHRARYWWASQAAIGRQVLDAGCGVGYGLEILSAAGAASVTGVDIDEEAVAEARRRFGDSAEEIARGDLRDLPFVEDSFDMVVCFEAIEHVDGGERVLSEFCRVLRPDGLLLVSSPNPDVYQQGNEYHVHEYRPAELAAILGERFANVASYRQHPWLASIIESSAGIGTAQRRRDVRATIALESGRETYSIHAASDAGLPALDDLLALGADFEVRWWQRQVDNAKRDATEAVEAVEAARADAREQIQTVEARARQYIATAESQARAHIEAAEKEAARNQAQAERREAEAKARLQETAAALLEANQSLAQIPTLRHRFEELQAQTDGLHAHIETLQGSKSWRYMAPLRRLRGVFRRNGVA